MGSIAEVVIEESIGVIVEGVDVVSFDVSVDNCVVVSVVVTVVISVVVCDGIVDIGCGVINPSHLIAIVPRKQSINREIQSITCAV